MLQLKTEILRGKYKSQRNHKEILHWIITKYFSFIESLKNKFNFSHVILSFHSIIFITVTVLSLSFNHIYIFFLLSLFAVCSHPANIYLFEVNNRNTRKRCGNDVIDVVFLLLTLNIFHTFFWLWTSKC